VEIINSPSHFDKLYRFDMVIHEIVIQGLEKTVASLNPYCAFYAPFMEKSRVPCTSIAYNSTSPNWKKNEIPMLKGSVSNIHQLLRLTLGIFSYDPINSDRLIGQCCIPLKSCWTTEEPQILKFSTIYHDGQDQHLNLSISLQILWKDKIPAEQLGE